MDPTVWGKHLWASIHFIALAFPDTPNEQQKLHYKQFFQNLHKVIPCQSCSEHLQDTLTNAHPLHANHLKNKNELFKWTVDLHNIVNKRLNKSTISLNDAYKIYMNKDIFNNTMCKASQNFDNKKSTNHTLNISLVLILLLFCVLLISMYSYYFMRVR